MHVYQLWSGSAGVCAGVIPERLIVRTPRVITIIGWTADLSLQLDCMSKKVTKFAQLQMQNSRFAGTEFVRYCLKVDWTWETGEQCLRPVSVLLENTKPSWGPTRQGRSMLCRSCVVLVSDCPIIWCCWWIRPTCVFLCRSSVVSAQDNECLAVWPAIYGSVSRLACLCSVPVARY